MEERQVVRLRESCCRIGRLRGLALGGLRSDSKQLAWTPEVDSRR